MATCFIGLSPHGRNTSTHVCKYVGKPPKKKYIKKISLLGKQCTPLHPPPPFSRVEGANAYARGGGRPLRQDSLDFRLRHVLGGIVGDPILTVEYRRKEGRRFVAAVGVETNHFCRLLMSGGWGAERRKTRTLVITSGGPLLPVRYRLGSVH